MAEENVLIVDDDGEAVISLARALKATGLQAQVHAASTPDKAQELFASVKPEVVILDLCLVESVGVDSGFSVLSSFIGSDPTCRIIVLTGHGSLEHGVRSLQLGASNFLEKPADIPHLLALINDGIIQSTIRRNYQKLKAEGKSELENIIIGSSERTKEFMQAVMYASQTGQAVLINGETGTGKGLCAHAIHRCSKRHTSNFVRYQPTFGTPDMVNSDLFGHVKGAFTGANEERKGLVAEAHNGTLFLDEIDELPLETQVVLLGVLQDKRFRPVGGNREQEINFRLITASNQDLDKCVESGKLRSDLYHRIAHFVVQIPPLRERREDIRELAEHILGKLRESEQINVFSVGDDAVKTLMHYEWPGNIRELQAVIEGAGYRAQYAGRSVIISDDIQLKASRAAGASSKSFNEMVSDYKLKLINDALDRNENNQLRAAEELQLDRSTMRRILARS
ncbi:MAG: sigma-54-dependent Fis family transcriptional regulator [Bdellovibrionales bacterium]|nr:sigma-54-dependent Fis family transcriptional regulator [Bdellovibrionales bacterium]